MSTSWRQPILLHKLMLNLLLLVFLSAKAAMTSVRERAGKSKQQHARPCRHGNSQNPNFIFAEVWSEKDCMKVSLQNNYRLTSNQIRKEQNTIRKNNNIELKKGHQKRIRTYRDHDHGVQARCQRVRTQSQAAITGETDGLKHHARQTHGDPQLRS